jgi:hypothetical protein
VEDDDEGHVNAGWSLNFWQEPVTTGAATGSATSGNGTTTTGGATSTATATTTTATAAATSTTGEGVRFLFIEDFHH